MSDNRGAALPLDLSVLFCFEIKTKKNVREKISKADKGHKR